MLKRVRPTYWLLLFTLSTSNAAELRVAVASNFAPAMSNLISDYQRYSSDKLTLITGSTGKHYAQIVQGAPFDIWFAADRERPALLEQQQLSIPGSRFTYAFGRLVLYSADREVLDAGALTESSYRHLAIANPRHAPYGRAAREVLTTLNLWSAVQSKLVLGENVAQTFQFIDSGGAELGLVAFSHTKLLSQNTRGWLVPPHLHQPIEQQAVLIKDSSAARRFLAYVRSRDAMELIRSFGYDVELQ
ncbi:MAG: molybdate ABC transporter substrate-binding protein [Gammaproteobacteria bacterium]|nr:molybdate ABC transporter substrate-binding protein [Gammaproteobacteria bacterium]